MYYINKIINEHMPPPDAETVNQITAFRDLLNRAGGGNIKDNPEILIRGNEIFFDKRRTFPNYQKDILLNDKKILLSNIVQPEKMKEVKSYCDVGCGHGACPKIFSDFGCKRSVGIDIQEHKYWSEFVEGTDNLEYICKDISKEQPEEKFQLVTSYSAFEHFDNPPLMLKSMMNMVEPGGYLYILFSPIWNSTDGHHNYRQIQFPWYHLIFSDEVINECHARLSVPETGIGFNKWSAFDFMNLFLGAREMRIVHFQTLFNFRHFYFAVNFRELLSQYTLEELMTSGFEIAYQKI